MPDDDLWETLLRYHRKVFMPDLRDIVFSPRGEMAAFHNETLERFAGVHERLDRIEERMADTRANIGRIEAMVADISARM